MSFIVAKSIEWKQIANAMIVERSCIIIKEAMFSLRFSIS